MQAFAQPLSKSHACRRRKTARRDAKGDKAFVFGTILQGVN
jgi:hypothetical protein